DEAGQYRWPKEIPVVRAWRFILPPMLLDVLQEQLPYHAISQAVARSQVDAAAVLEMGTTPATLPELQTLSNAKLLDYALAAANPTIGPKPSSWSRDATRNVDRDAFTYAFRFGSFNV
ncbi:MAG: hypothetical protein WBC93_20780, partial [Sulfitobacter sp.]